MTPTKLLIGQILIVLSILLLGVWAATQWAASMLGHQPELGRPWLVLGGLRIYRPWALFPWWFTYRGKPLRTANTRTWRAALKACGIKDFRWHDLRHTWAIWLRQNDVPTWVLQELGGWKSESMVRRYAHMSVTHLRPFADQLTFPVTAGNGGNAGRGPDEPGHKNGHNGARPRLHLMVSR